MVNPNNWPLITLEQAHSVLMHQAHQSQNGWAYYQKKVPTPALRMEGGFRVETTEGELACGDGWLCIDAGGNPYPVSADEFARIYEKVQ